MRIIEARVIVCSPGRNFVTLKIVTDDGVVGWGDATVNGRELSVASYLRDHVVPLLIGRDARRIEDTWHYLYKGSYWRRGPITMAAISAVDIALWDIAAKTAGVPLYQLLGGASRERIRAYGHAHGSDIQQLLDSVQQCVEQGFTAVRIQSGVPGLRSTYGVGSGLDGRYEPADGPAPAEEEWDSSSYIRSLPKVFAAVRERFGDELDVLHDVHHRLTPIEAAGLAKQIEEFRPFWMEDPIPADNPEGLRIVRSRTTVPLATGEVLNSIQDYRILLGEQLIDYIRSAVSHSGGVTAVRKLVDFGALSQARSAFHGPTDISPIGFAAALHLDMAIQNFGIQEFMPRSKLTLEAFPHAYHFIDGYLMPGDEPGLGVSLDEIIAATYEYTPAYLPVNRLKDGTIHDW